MSEGRLTRAAAKAAAASISNPSVAASDPAINPTAEATEVRTKASTTEKKTSKRKGKALAKKRPVAKKKITKKVTTKKTRTTKTKVTLQEVVSGQLPHNLGPIPAKAETSPVGSDKENQPLEGAVVPALATSVSEAQASLDAANTTIVDQDLGIEGSKKEKKKRNQYGLTPGQTPFPDWPQPTAEACEVVNTLLSQMHGEVVPPKTIPPPSLTVTGCGEVPSVLDALIRTLLSGATTGRNSAFAFDGLVKRFGILDEGIGKGSVNWDAVRQASQQDVFEAIKRGGLAEIKSKHLKGILDQVHTENKARRDQLLSIPSITSPANTETGEASSSAPAEKTDKDQYEIACADQNFLSLNHLHSLRTEQVMVELTKYPGIGPKTAACVILFCLQRPCFAVDTHIFRICKWLGWLPPKVNEVTAFSHLEVRIPDHLKYSLHQLFITHGKNCPRCRASTTEKCEGWDAGCAIDHLVARSGKRKGGPLTSLKKVAKGSKEVKKKATKKSTKVTKKKVTAKKGKKTKVAAAKTTKKKVTAGKRKAEPDSESNAAPKKPKIDNTEEVPEEGPAEEKEDSDETFSGFSDSEGESESEWEDE
ncbi:hypothetical protein N7493_010039 [Penicillium malachiteum]|uniref:HhH-GPD domain-containing protein n=1 Tax=Penicillium malachiteum TaxID=1324776 RepID=A0AAD6MSB0_9EURO|nr:hypothetical protein N7493_010039 [Penicillium malachiteum]